jgi:hypothetical protein
MDRDRAIRPHVARRKQKEGAMTDKLRRSLALSTLALLGAMSAFLLGARAGAALDGHVNHVTIARVPMPMLK